MEGKKLLVICLVVAASAMVGVVAGFTVMKKNEARKIEEEMVARKARDAERLAKDDELFNKMLKFQTESFKRSAETDRKAMEEFDRRTRVPVQ